jgi:hypothetical protein
MYVYIYMSLAHGRRLIDNVNDDVDAIFGGTVVSRTGVQLASVADASMEPESVQHHTTLTSLHEDKIDRLQKSYRTLLDEYQRSNANIVNNMKGRPGRDYRRHLERLHESIMNTGRELLKEMDDVPASQWNAESGDRKSMMQRHIGMVHDAGKFYDSPRDRRPTEYHLLSGAMLGVLVGYLGYHYVRKGK